MIIWVHCRARKRMPGAIIFPLLTHPFSVLWLTEPSWHLAADMHDPVLLQVSERIRLWQMKPASRIFWYLAETCQGCFREANKVRHATTWRRTVCLCPCTQPTSANQQNYCGFGFLAGTLCFALSSPSSCEAWSNSSAVKLLCWRFYPPVEHLIGLSCVVVTVHTLGPSERRHPQTLQCHLPAEHLHFPPYAKYVSLMQLQVAAAERESNRSCGGKGHTGTREAYGNKEYDRETGSAGWRGESCCHVSQQLEG